MHAMSSKLPKAELKILTINGRLTRSRGLRILQRRQYMYKYKLIPMSSSI